MSDDEAGNRDRDTGSSGDPDTDAGEDDPFDQLDSVMGDTDTPFDVSRDDDGRPGDAGTADDAERVGSPGSDDSRLASERDDPGMGPESDDSPFDGAFSLDPAGDDESGSDSPFDELEADTGGRSGDADLDELFDEMFTETSTDGLDAESVWEALQDTEDHETSGDEHIVSTRAFCAQCEHVADPPEVRCTYEGSEIVEFVDKRNVRVRTCPIVAQRSQVGEMD